MPGHVLDACFVEDLRTAGLLAAGCTNLGRRWSAGSPPAPTPSWLGAWSILRATECESGI